MRLLVLLLLSVFVSSLIVSPSEKNSPSRCYLPVVPLKRVKEHIPSLTILTARALARQILKQDTRPQFNPSHCFKQSLSSLPEDLQQVLFDEIRQHPQALSILPRFTRQLIHPAYVNALCFTNDDTAVITCCDDPYLRIWDVATGKKVAEIQTDSSELNALVLSNDGSRLIIGGKNVIYVMSIETNTFEHKLKHTGSISRLAINTSNSLLASGSFPHHTICVWDLTTGNLICSIDDIEERVNNISFDTKGTTLMCKDKYFLKIWDIPSGRCLQEIDCGVTEAAEFDTIHQRFLYVPKNDSRSIKKINLVSYESEAPCDITLIHRISRFLINDQNSLLIGMTGAFIDCYNLDDGSLLECLENHDKQVLHIALSNNGSIIGSTSYDRSAVIEGADISITTLKQLLTTIAHYRKKQARSTAQNMSDEQIEINTKSNTREKKRCCIQ